MSSTLWSACCVWIAVFHVTTSEAVYHNNTNHDTIVSCVWCAHKQRPHMNMCLEAVFSYRVWVRTSNNKDLAEYSSLYAVTDTSSTESMIVKDSIKCPNGEDQLCLWGIRLVYAGNCMNATHCYRAACCYLAVLLLGSVVIGQHVVTGQQCVRTRPIFL